MRPVLFGIAFQLVVAFALTNIQVFITALESAAGGVMKLKDATLEGTKFVFGYLGGSDLPFDLKAGGSTFVFAFQALPTIILVGTLSAILTYLKVLPFLSKVIGSVFKLVFGVKESVGIVSAAKIFVGQLEAPLLIKSQLERLSKQDMFIIISLAFATASASVMPIYAGALEVVCPDAMKHILIASVISVISVLIVSSIIMPREDELAENRNALGNQPYNSFMVAISKGLNDGISVWLSIVGALIGMVALIALVDLILAQLPLCSGSPITLQRIFGIIMYPIAWLIGIDKSDILAVAQILGTKLVLNETIAYFELAKAAISPQSVCKTIYAINNFGNFACIGITVGGMATLAPGQKCVTQIAWKAFTAGLLATFITAALMGMLVYS
ncbi:nucleoside:proton symporter [Alphaproteobacteria bacterium]|nr:nucleoside:proton symporter [Alphaproteobacteria bacterium]